MTRRTRHTTRLLTYNGQTKTVAEWAATNSITPSAIYERLKNGWTVEEVCANTRVDRSARRMKTAPSTQHKQPTSIVSQRLHELKRMDLMLQREVNRTLRQFCRDLEAIVSRGVDRDFLKTRFDRSIPVAPERV
jgi:hypothetical protein